VTAVFGVLVLLFIVVPIAELAVILKVGQTIGVLNTIGALILVSVVGASLVKRVGLGVLRRARRQLDAGVLPGREVVDGIVVLMAGALLLTPGFLTDLFGLCLLLPPVRAGIRRSALRQLRRRAHLIE
jgi:UPF0716 protein FxsA